MNIVGSSIPGNKIPFTGRRIKIIIKRESIALYKEWLFTLQNKHVYRDGALGNVLWNSSFQSWSYCPSFLLFPTKHSLLAPLPAILGHPPAYYRKDGRTNSHNKAIHYLIAIVFLLNIYAIRLEFTRELLQQMQSTVVYGVHYILKRIAFSPSLATATFPILMLQKMLGTLKKQVLREETQELS